MKRKQKQWFTIGRLHRDDLKALGFKNTDKISSKDMQAMADELNDTLGWGDTHTELLFEMAQEDYNLKLK